MIAVRTDYDCSSLHLALASCLAKQMLAVNRPYQVCLTNYSKREHLGLIRSAKFRARCTSGPPESGKMSKFAKCSSLA